MMYLSQLLGMPVEDEQGERVGKISDVLVPLARAAQAGSVYPSALLLAGADVAHPWRVLPRDMAWQGASLRLRVPIDQLAMLNEEASAAQEVSLAREVLDRQVIDIGRKKTVRVNDICFAETWQILGIDNSTLGLVRRLAPTWLLGVKSKQAPTNLIPWSRIELIEASQPEDDEQAAAPPIARMQSGQLAELRPADIAEIVHQLTPEQGAHLLESLDDETAADAMQEIDTVRQRHILENIEAERAADILQAMEPDEAADLLAQLPEERATELLSLMTPEESEDVQELLEYEADTAGGLMTTSYLALGQDCSAALALDALREKIQSEEMRAAYIYCVEDETREEQRLLGVVSVWRLLITPPTQPLREIMLTDLITVQPDTDPPTVAQIMAKYNLLAVPVVNEAGLIEGIVTIDDVLDVLLPPDKRRRPPRMY
jgi:magnesium transporter